MGRPLISHYFDKQDLQRISRTKQPISQGTLPALQCISEAKQRISQVTYQDLSKISYCQKALYTDILMYMLQFEELINVISRI